MKPGDNLIYTTSEGKLVRVGNSKLSYPDAEQRRNFLIVSRYGDWSGFRTLAECEEQFPELEANIAKNPDRYSYSVVERF